VAEDNGGDVQTLGEAERDAGAVAAGGLLGVGEQEQRRQGFLGGGGVAQGVEVGEAVLVEDAGPVQQVGVDQCEGLVEGVGDVQPWPAGDPGVAEQCGEGLLVDDDFGALGGVGGCSCRDRGDDHAPGGGVAAGADESDTARGHPRGRSRFGRGRYDGVVGVVLGGQDRGGQVRQVLVDAGEVAAAALQPHQGGGRGDRDGQGPRDDAACGQNEIVTGTVVPAVGNVRAGGRCRAG
jgi:hypothetical protein